MRISTAAARRLGLLPKDAAPKIRRAKPRAVAPSLPPPSMAISFVLPTRPIPKERHRTDTRDGHTYTPRRTVKFAKTVAEFGAHAMRGYGPFTGPVNATITFYFPVPKSWPELRRLAALSGRILPTVRPDLDNTIKSVLDALNGVVYVDDAQITDKNTSKRYADVASIEISFAPMAAEGTTSLAAQRKAA